VKIENSNDSNHFDPNFLWMRLRKHISGNTPSIGLKRVLVNDCAKEAHFSKALSQSARFELFHSGGHARRK